MSIPPLTSGATNHSAPAAGVGLNCRHGGHGLRRLRAHVHDGDVRTRAARARLHPRVRVRMRALEYLRVPLRCLAIWGGRTDLVGDRAAPLSAVRDDLRPA